ncbi:anti-sigma-F factor Fin [Aneurinibacillus sp. REN35]|uniref:anti-sigma-F factor Fin n=1 Tax=Aneurinibacillus sp. REN35 TaxID=3237286 RepID=UPI0035285369
MAIRYICPHCRTQHGAIDHPDATEQRLGLHFLTREEREHIISYEANGDMVAHVTCEYCSEAINRHPELTHPLQ